MNPKVKKKLVNNTLIYYSLYLFYMKFYSKSIDFQVINIIVTLFTARLTNSLKLICLSVLPTKCLIFIEHKLSNIYI